MREKKIEMFSKDCVNIDSFVVVAGDFNKSMCVHSLHSLTA